MAATLRLSGLMALLVAVLLLIGGGADSAADRAESPFPITQAVVVQRIIDGDTIVVADTIGGLDLPVTVRLAYVDTPELRGNVHGPASPDGPRAKAFLAELIPPGSEVRLAATSDTLRRDGFGRVIAIVVTADGPAQEALIRAGWSGYVTEYGEAAEPWHARFQDAEAAGAGDTK